MVTKNTKTRKRRGLRAMGYGIKGHHRKHPSGRGKAGGLQHHRIAFDKYHPGFFGRVGKRNFHVLRNREYCPVINLEKLWSLVPEETRLKCKDAKQGEKVPVIDCVESGFFKVLGRGSLPPQPMIVKARAFTEEAERKIKEVGGVCIKI